MLGTINDTSSRTFGLSGNECYPISEIDSYKCIHNILFQIKSTGFTSNVSVTFTHSARGSKGEKVSSFEY